MQLKHRYLQLMYVGIVSLLLCTIINIKDEGGGKMTVNIIENADVKEVKITIECCKVDDGILQLLNSIKKYEDRNKKLIGISNEETYCIDKKDILYFESVDRKTFCYTADGIYETAMKLYEIEEQFTSDDYMRISKSAIVNLNNIKSIRPDFGGRILATMENGEKIYISRQYVSVLKKKLGIGR